MGWFVDQGKLIIQCKNSSCPKSLLRMYKSLGNYRHEEETGTYRKVW